MQIKRVLIVDDEEIVRVRLDDVLTAAGFSVTAASGTDEAMELLPEGHSFAAVITDVLMPGKTGIDLLRALRTGGQEELPVIILTGSPSVESAMAAVGDACVRYLTKSDANKQLLDALQELVARNSNEVRQAKPASEPRMRTAPLSVAGNEEFDAALEKVWIAFQPIVSWAHQRPFGYEALVRSTHEELSNPALLFDAAERLGRVAELGRCIRRRVAENVPAAPVDVRIFVNLHASDLNDDDLYGTDEGLARHAERIVFEVTERASLDCVQDLKERLRALREAGFSIAVDDLGAGYAGLASFGQLEPEVVKLDMSLVRNIDAQPRIQRVVQSMLSACSGDMGALVVCEGVETSAERDTLLGLGADLLQGYLFGRPGRGFTPPHL